MPSPALDAFNIWVDGTSVNAAAKAAVKVRAEQLYQESVGQEAAAHIHLHAAAEASPDPDDQRIAQYLEDVLVSFASRTDFHASDIATLVAAQSTAEEKWGAALGPIFAADSVARAGRIFDALLLRFDTPGVRTRLKAFRDLVTDRLGP